MKNVRWAIISVFILIVLSACQASATPSTPQISTVEADLVAEGYLSPLRSADLAFTTSGRVAEVLVKEGDAVTAGQPLARLELVGVEARQAELARARQEELAARQALEAVQDSGEAALAQAKFAAADLEKQVDDARKAVEKAKDPDTGDVEPLLVAQAEARQALLEQQLADAEKFVEKLGTDGLDKDKLESAEARLETARASLVLAEAAARVVELTAPWNGVVGLVNLTVGQVVAPGQGVISLADMGGWIIQTDNLTEIEVVGLKAGDPVKIVLDAIPSQEIAGTISAIRPKFELKRGDITYTVNIAVQNPPASALWGMTAAVTFSR